MSEDFDHQTISFADEVEIELRAVLNRMNRVMNAADPYEWENDQYEEAAQACERMAAKFRAVIGHQHVWNSDDYCDVCGMDGRS